MPILITAAADLDPGRIRQIAAGQRFEIAPALLEEVDRRCAAARAVLRGASPVYGVNTGMGALVGVRLTEPEQLAHQRNLLLARATGGPPWLDAADARAVIAVRLRTFLSGDSGVSAALCLRLAEFLDLGIAPAVPRTGVGSAGEIIPLAHAFGPLIGIGRVLGPAAAPPPAAPAGAAPPPAAPPPAAPPPAGPAPAGPAPAGPAPADATALAADRTRPAAEVLRARGLDEFALGPREGHALLAGVPGATALSLLRLAEARTLEAAMESAAALSVASARASRDPYAPAAARGDEVMAGVLTRIRAAAGELTEPRTLQAPVSFRVAGPVLAHLLRAAGALAGAAGRALAGVTDSPAFLDGRFTGTAGFHGIDLAAHCDGLTAALAHAAEVGAARVHRLLDSRVTGLPAQLAARPGPDAGLVAVHKRAAGEVHAMRRLAAASPVGLIETSGGQEDVQSFAWEAADVLRQALIHARAVTACELLAGYQACALSGGAAPDGCRPMLERLAGVVAPITADRPFGEDIERIIGMLAAGL
jgi:histidine ammonia-lyase